MTRLLKTRMLAGLVACGVAWATDTAQADTTIRRQPQYDIGYNFYVGGGINGRGGHPAQMYPAPLPVPERVGHTYITYQPLMPHEFLYKHSRHYWRYNSALSPLPVNRTKVRWH